MKIIIIILLMLVAATSMAQQRVDTISIDNTIIWLGEELEHDSLVYFKENGDTVQYRHLNSDEWHTITGAGAISDTILYYENGEAIQVGDVLEQSEIPSLIVYDSEGNDVQRGDTLGMIIHYNIWMGDSIAYENLSTQEKSDTLTIRMVWNE